ncbi:hypothetical protein PV327_007034 [Microctonus hyperodae]|uniref:RNA helicase n=1 Tax=Microctonus hyperodae TaxID=165561 RepID=A0AA39F5J2_MICHY|nr:hypothetical protein PV327_007034 [Microctonus hyperodae]
MFSLVLNTAKYFWGSSKNIESDINDAFEKLKVTCDENEDFIDDDEVCEAQNTEGSFYQDGIITSIKANSVLIDDRYICDSENVACLNLNVGTKVHYKAYQRDENSDPKIQKIISIVNDDEYSKKCVAKNQMFKKSVVVKVMERKGRIFHCEPSNIKFNLDKINSTFVPYVGDWLTLKSLVELNEESGDLSGDILEIDEIQPLRSKIKIGLITKYDQQTGVGVVENDTIFVKSLCKPGYIPCIGDKVVCDSIESDQGIYTWRCLTVVPLCQTMDDNKTTPPADATIVSKRTCNNNMKSLLLNKNGITITDNLFFQINVNETKEMQVVIKNCGNTTSIINKCIFMSKKHLSQLSLISPDVNTVTSLKPAETITYTFKCTAKFVGTTEELVIFSFNQFSIGRNIKITVNVKNVSTSTDDADTNTYYRNNSNKLARQDIYDQQSYIPGIRPVKPPSFIAVRNGIFKIPQRLWDIILPCVNQRMSQTEMETIVGGELSHLHDILNPNNYRDRFHTLLFLEEIGLIIDMQKYDMDSAIMIPSGEYLVLKVPGLAEKRPSLIVGDRAIVTFKWDTSSGNMKHEGFIHKIKSSEIYLKFHGDFHSTYGSEDCQVTFKSSFSSLARCHNAVNLAMSTLGPKILFPTSIVKNEPQISLEELSQCTIADNESESLSLKSSGSSSTSSSNSPGKYAKLASLLSRIDSQKGNVINNKSIDPHISQIKKRKLIWFNKKLNHYQKEAVRNILYGVARPLPYIIFGPPGTGKTITLCEVILQILTTIPESRLLVATPSNSSANLIAERLLDSGVLKPGDLVRLIAHHCFNDDSIPEKLLPYCATGNLAAENSTRNSYRSHEGVRMNCTMSVLGRHRITVGTCTALGILYNMGFPRGHFSHILVDEAGQATEPEIMIPLSFTHSSCGQIILAGDPMQLGPVVNSRLAEYFGLGESFLIRLLQQFPYQRDTESYEMGYDPRLVTKLIINYRSLPEILELPNTLFYDLELKANLSATTSPEAELLRSIALILPTRDGQPPAIVFHGINGENCQDSDSPSWYNPAEATQVYLYLLRLYDCGISENDIGIIAPYKKQVSQIRALLTELDMQLPKIGSVEEFQGQERKIIILSTVRSNNKYVNDDVKYSLGFIASPRRLNVAITRARSLIIIIGNPNLLTQDPYWRSVLNYCIKNKSYTGCDFPLGNIEANYDKLKEIDELSN